MSTVRGFFSGVFCFLLFTTLVLLGIVITANLTILNPDFVASEIDKLGVYSAIAEQTKDRLPAQQFISDETVDKILAELKPWFEEQASTVIHGVWGYLKEDRKLNVVIALEQVRSVVKKHARQAMLKSLPPELQGASESQMEAYVSQLYAEIDKVIPINFVLNEASVGAQIVAQIQQVKKIIHYIDTAYKWLIWLAVLLVLLIALVNWWQPKPITRSIGITFILVGVAYILGSLFNFLISGALSGFISQSQALPELQAKLPQLASDLTSPMRMYGIGFLAAGIVLVVISVLFRSPEASPDARHSHSIK